MINVIGVLAASSGGDLARDELPVMVAAEG